jgi:murein DD-endopeptidase MepM/ murein hydrolase activator NlpD
VRALASYDGSLYAGTGVWSEAKVWRWTGATWVLIKNLSSDFGVYDGVQSLASANGNLYAGLTLSGSVFVYDGINWSVSISIPGSSCARLAVIGHTLWAGTCGGDVYLLDGGIWTPVGSTGEGYVSDFVQYDGFVYAATCYNGRIYRTTAPTPFLDLPFEYGGSVQAFRQALLDTDDDDKGRVDSWFDHEYPYGWGNANNRTNGSLLLYDGKRRDKNPSHGTLGCYEERCYDGHDGIDFAHLSGDPPDLPIHPAARGEVVEFEDSCFKGQTYCGDGFGNYVIVDHQNGYFTLYAHLKEVLVGIQSVTADTILGTMGATGNVVGADGTHLHFGVYRDDGDGVWEGRSQDKPVDPYGWNEDEGGTDPWVEAGGEASYSLWIHEPCPSETVSGSQGAVITDTTGDVQATIPADAFTGSATFELSPGSVAGVSAQLLSSVRSFWLRLLEWLQEGSGLQSATTLQSTTQLTLTKPITLTVTYTDTDVLHLDVSQLALHRWDEEQEMWQPLTTTLDLVNHVITAQTEDLGDFDLQAPLLCATDDLEPDDGYAAARWVWPNDWPLARGLDIPQDSDWSRFDAIQGVTYTISTQNLAVGADTVLNLYDVDALTLLANNDDGDGGPASELVWTAPYTGTFFVETVSAPGGTTDCSATYELTIVTIPGDVIADCRVDIADIMQVAIRWRLSAANPDPDNDPTTPNYETLFDLDRDGDIDIVDIMRVAAQWGETCW